VEVPRHRFPVAVGVHITTITENCVFLYVAEEEEDEGEGEGEEDEDDA
jgi:hypothetical protein